MAASAIVALLIGLCWTENLDQRAAMATENALQSTLLTYALARTLNGVISVAQGTEIALQPAGVGVVLSAGQILDPLNDLVERFSWIVLVAAASLALQLLLGEMLTNTLLNSLTSLVALAWLVTVWRPAVLSPALRTLIARSTLVLLALRFAIVAAGLSMSLLGSGILEDREQAAIDYLSVTSTEIERTTSADVAPTTANEGLLDQFGSFIDAQKESLDIDRRLERMQLQIESTVSEVLSLIAIYLLKSLMIPLATLAVLYGAARYGWKALAS